MSTTLHSNVTHRWVDSGQIVTRTLPLINNDIFRVVQIILPIFIFIIASLFGIAVNIVNIIVFTKQGLQESITVGFFALSISDLILVACPLGVVIGDSADLLLPDYPISFKDLHFISTGNIREMAYFFSNVLTALLSFERCCCVILPFKVKQIFTLQRSRVIIVALLLLVVIGYTPVFTTVELRWMPSLVKNDSKVLGIWFAPNRKEVHSYSFYITGILTPTLSLCLVMCTTSIMVYGLHRSSTFRQKAQTMADNSKQGLGTTLSSRDVRLVKVMVLLGIILAVCNLPYVVFVYAMYIEPELEFNATYHNTYIIVYQLCYLLSCVNASANCFVYYKNSSRYKEVFDEIFGLIMGK